MEVNLKSARSKSSRKKKHKSLTRSEGQGVITLVFKLLSVAYRIVKLIELVKNFF